jgi:transposase
MGMKRYSPEFRAEAIALVRSRPEVTVAQVADDLGVNRETLRSWIRIAEGRKNGPHWSPPSPAKVPEPGSVPAAEEVAALRKRVAELEEEREILRKAAKYFAGETRW